MVKPIYHHMIHSKVCGTQKFIISGHPYAIDMGPEIPFRNAAKAFMENLICNFSDGTVFIDAQHGKLCVMIPCHK